MISDSVDDGSVILADKQTSGRGRNDRVWSSPAGGLWFSIILYPFISAKKGMFLTMVASVSVANTISKLTCLDSEIKWPNDILINGKKVCGILTEIETKNDKISHSIIGIGINVNNELENGLKNIATSLKFEIGQELSTIDLFKKILENFDYNYNKIITSDYSFIKNQWLSKSKMIGRKIQILEDDKILIGIIINVDDDGCLILKTKNDEIRINNGDIKFL